LEVSVSEPAVSLPGAQAIVETKTAPRLTLDSIKAQIFSVDYLRHGTLTICVVTMKNGFNVIGKAAPADPANYDAAVGERYAYEDAVKQLWHLEGYLLCERLRGERL
jgi:hypothetical protein